MKSPKKRSKKPTLQERGKRQDETARRFATKESHEIVLAIRRGKIDAFVTSGAKGEEVLVLQNADHPYRVLVETINDGVAALDERGVVLYANSRFAAILRAPEKNFIGSQLQKHVETTDRAALKTLISEGISNSTQGEIMLHAAEGRPRLVRLALTPVKNSEPRTVCIVATELTELAEANAAIRANEESLRQLSARLLKLQDEERRHIARDLHDVTGQKLAVQSMSLAQILNRSNGLDDDSRRVLKECAALNKEVGEEIRTLSYLLHPPLLDELGLASAVKWYAEGFERKTGIRTKVEVAPGLTRLPADVEVTLFRVMQESLTNVHRYSGTPRAHVRVKATAKEVELRIGDFGKGMRPQELNSARGGTAPMGVGIQGMKERVRQLGGRLEITSKPDEGTVVTATIPLAASQAVMTEIAATSAAVAPMMEKARAGRENTVAGKHAPASKQILIADDHEMIRRGLRTMLEKEKAWEICGEAINGEEVVEKAAQLRPDLIILDINMPVLNGLAAVRQILRSTPQTKILVFTVHDSDQMMNEAKAAGAHGYVSKSNASDELMQMVRNLLERPEASVPAAMHAPAPASSNVN